jgi:hypothetical protein
MTICNYVTYRKGEHDYSTARARLTTAEVRHCLISAFYLIPWEQKWECLIIVEYCNTMDFDGCDV